MGGRESQSPSCLVESSTVKGDTFWIDLKRRRREGKGLFRRLSFLPAPRPGERRRLPVGRRHRGRGLAVARLRRVCPDPVGRVVARALERAREGRRRALPLTSGEGARAPRAAIVIREEGCRVSVPAQGANHRLFQR